VLEYLKLGYFVIATVLLSVVVYYFDEHTSFGGINKHLKHVIIGVLFGILAIIGTEYGVKYDAYVLNVRDAAPLCAGLLFGPVPGIIAGVIGGVERYFAVYWGVGEYTQIACSIGTILAGFLGALIRYSMFRYVRPKWFYGLAAGIVAEITHLAFILGSHAEDIRTAYGLVRAAGIQLIAANSIAVALSCYVVYNLSERQKGGKYRYKTISEKFQRASILMVILSLVFSIFVTTMIQYRFSNNDTEQLLTNTLNDVLAEIEEISDRTMMTKTEAVLSEIGDVKTVSNKELVSLADKYQLAEINIIDELGYIQASNIKKYINYNMFSSQQSLRFMYELKHHGKATQPYTEIGYDASISRKYCGFALDNGWYIQTGYSAENIANDTSDQIQSMATHRRIDREGWLLILDSNYFIVSSGKGDVGKHCTYLGLNPWNPTAGPMEVTEFGLYGENHYVMYATTEGYILLAAIPSDDVLFDKNLFAIIIAFVEIIVFAFMFLQIVKLVEVFVVKNVRKFNDGFREITSGNLDVEIERARISEFFDLANDANETVIKLKQLIDEASQRVDAELQFAKNIQEGALERNFPAFPSEDRFDIHCTMDTAKEVGGDFYDFFFLDDHTFAFEVADVSGKGIPAAMFMMTGKTLIKSMAQQRISTAEILRKTNDELCAHNEAGMFITCWMGIVDLDTGKVQYTCAGHNPPLLKRKDGKYEYLKSKINLVLAAMEGVPYDVNEVTLFEGDELFLYTDGVTEATDAYNELYGEDRLQSILNEEMPYTSEKVCAVVKEDIDMFVGDADQFDDITMLSFKFERPHRTIAGKEPKKEEKVAAKQNLVVFEELEDEGFNADINNNSKNVILEEVEENPMGNIVFEEIEDGKVKFEEAEEEILLVSEPEEEEVLLMSTKDEEVLLMSTKDEEEEILMTSNEPEEEILLTSSKPEEEEILLMSKPEKEEIVLTSEPEEEVIFTSKSHVKEEEELIFNIRPSDIKETKIETVSLKENGKSIEEMTVLATTENVPVVTAFVEEQLEKYNCPMKDQMQINIAVDELVSNIAYYAYNPDIGPATIRISVTEDPLEVEVSFIDHGKPYDPLKKADPDTGLPLEERGVGGLGIYMVKQTMDDIQYEYKDGNNILSIKKKIG